MPQSLVQIYLHVVFSTKLRQPFLNDKDFRKRTHAYLAGICRNLESPALIIGGVEDHVHFLCRFGKTIAVADFIRDVKRDSSKWVKEERADLAEFHWQLGYGAFSVSPAHVDALKHYIANQEEHHRQETFQDEFRRLCKNMDCRSTNGMCGTRRVVEPRWGSGHGGGVPVVEPRWGSGPSGCRTPSQGALPRPWALLSNRFAVRRWPGRRPHAHESFVVKPLRG